MNTCNLRDDDGDDHDDPAADRDKGNSVCLASNHLSFVLFLLTIYIFKFSNRHFTRIMEVNCNLNVHERHESTIVSYKLGSWLNLATSLQLVLTY